MLSGTTRRRESADRPRFGSSKTRLTRGRIPTENRLSLENFCKEKGLIERTRGAPNEANFGTEVACSSLLTTINRLAPAGFGEERAVLEAGKKKAEEKGVSLRAERGGGESGEIGRL